MNMLARAGKSSYVALTETNSQPASTGSRVTEQHGAATSRTHSGPSLIGAGLSVTGRLDSAGDIQIEGHVEGEVRGQGVRIGSGAVIKGTVVGEIVQLAGTIEGNIEARTAILAKTARVTGDISYESLQIEEGAYLNGNCRPRRKEAASPAPALPAFDRELESIN